MLYQACCEQVARQEPTWNLCPHCQTVLVRCERCQALCSEDDWCEACFQIVSLVDVGPRFQVGEAIAVPLRFAHQGQRVVRLQRIRYGINCGEACVREKSVNRVLPPAEVVTVLLDGLVATAGHQALQCELLVEAEGREYAFRGEALLDRTRAAQMAARDVNIQIDHVDKAADVNIKIGGDDARRPEVDEARWEPMPWIPVVPAHRGVNRRTPIVFPHAESGEPRTYFLAQRNALRCGVARPEKYDGVDVCLRLYPQREGVNEQANESMSRSHFTLMVRDRRLHLVDHSTNGTTINLTRIPREIPQPLRDGDVVAPYTDPKLIRHRRWVVHLLEGPKGVERVEWTALGGS